MRRWLTFSVMVFMLSFMVGSVVVWAETNCEGKSGDDLFSCLETQIGELTKSLQMSQAATKPLEEEVKRLTLKIGTIQKQITMAVQKTVQLEKDVADRNEKVSASYAVLAIKTREFYKRLREEPLWLSLLRYTNLGEMRREMTYRIESNDRDKQTIIGLVKEIGQLEIDKKKVEENKIALTKLQADLDKQSSFFEGEIKKAKAYQTELSGRIAALSAKQQAILAEKTGSFQTTVGDVPLADDENASIDGFRNKAPNGSFAVFSFGVPHFKGMSQYGAYGRAKEGQNAETILKTYYGDVEIKKDYDPGKQIGVAGYGRMDIETYVKRIYELPNSWGDNGGMEALKAQAVAARTYALAWTREGSGGNICTSEDCQVYKNANKGGNWETSVNATRGWVIYKNGKIISPWYASTSGGYQESYNALEYLKEGLSYNTPAFWDTKNGRDGWTSQAYEKIAGSPWFYKAWYKTRSGDTCGRDNPWLSSEEMADILNAWKVLTGGSDERVSPLGSCWSGNPYSMEELRNKGGFSSVSGVSVTYANNGATASVVFETNKGSVTLSGSEFKTAFNLRSPARVSLKSGLFNIEKK